MESVTRYRERKPHNKPYPVGGGNCGIVYKLKSETMDISKISKPKVLAALFNAAKPLGLGFIHYDPNHVMNEVEAAGLLQNQTYFDYHEGRLMKVDLSSDELRTSMYNRDNGENAAEDAIGQIS